MKLHAPRLLLLVAAYACASHGSSAEIIRLGMNKISRNSEVELMLHKYEAHARVARGDSAGDVTRAEDGASPDSAVVRSRPYSNLGAATPSSLVKAVETRLSAGEGSHTIEVVVGGQLRELIIDTGSGKTAFVCENCYGCGNEHKHAPFHFTNKSRFLRCDPHALGDEARGGCLECHKTRCRYGQRYVEGDYWEAYKMSDEMWFSPTDPSFNATVEFGCIYEQTGCFNEQSSDGIMGFSRHPDAIFEQFHKQGVTQSRIFAQCLSDTGGSLTLGGVDMAVHTAPVRYTPLRDTGYQYWTVELDHISIGDVAVTVSNHIFNEDRGCVFDSGTTFVYLPTKARAAFEAAWTAAVGSDDLLPVSDSFYRVSDDEIASLPPICFHFANNAHLCMAPDAYLYRLGRNEFGGTVYFGDNAHSTIIGANALAGHQIIYDVDNERIGIAPANCDAALGRTQQQQRMVALEINPGGDTFRASFDHTYWTQVAFASVTFFAVAGLINAVWLELRERDDGASREGKPLAACVKLSHGTSSEETTADGAFAFFLMHEHDDNGI